MLPRLLDATRLTPAPLGLHQQVLAVDPQHNHPEPGR